MATAIIYLLPQPDPQLVKLEAVRAACDRGLLAAQRGDLFGTSPGLELLWAIYSLTEINAVADMADDVAAEFGL